MEMSSKKIYYNYIRRDRVGSTCEKNPIRGVLGFGTWVAGPPKFQDFFTWGEGGIPPFYSHKPRHHFLRSSISTRGDRNDVTNCTFKWSPIFILKVMCLITYQFNIYEANTASTRPGLDWGWRKIVYVYYSELMIGSIEQKKEDRKQQLKDQAEEERRMKILTS